MNTVLNFIRTEESSPRYLKYKNAVVATTTTMEATMAPMTGDDSNDITAPMEDKAGTLEHVDVSFFPVFVRQRAVWRASLHTQTNARSSVNWLHPSWRTSLGPSADLSPRRRLQR
jgi:hypothetical protein